MKIVVLCTDDRMQQVCDNLAKDYDVIGICDELKSDMRYGDIDVLILPVKGADDQGHVQGCSINPSFWNALKKETIVFSGLKTAFLKSIPQRTLYYMEDESVIHDNAILTAEGVLNELISCCPMSLYDVSIDIVGYGHCGKVIFEMLSNLQLNVRVIRRQCVEDKQFLMIKHWQDCGDIIINTSIQHVMDEQRMLKWKHKPVIIDIATPDVIDSVCAQRLGIKMIKAGNLPGRFASVTAGNIIASFIRGNIYHEG